MHFLRTIYFSLNRIWCLEYFQNWKISFRHLWNSKLASTVVVTVRVFPRCSPTYTNGNSPGPCGVTSSRTRVEISGTLSRASWWRRRNFLPRRCDLPWYRAMAVRMWECVWLIMGQFAKENECVKWFERDDHIMPPWQLCNNFGCFLSKVGGRMRTPW